MSERKRMNVSDENAAFERPPKSSPHDVPFLRDAAPRKVSPPIPTLTASGNRGMLLYGAFLRIEVTGVVYARFVT
jgi:hypothetical protein